MALSQGLSAQRTSRPLVHGHTHSPRELSPAQAEARLRADLDRIYGSMEEDSRETLLELAELAIPVVTRALERSRAYIHSQPGTLGIAERGAIILQELAVIRREPELFSDGLLTTHLLNCREILWEISVLAPPKLRREFLRAGRS